MKKLLTTIATTLALFLATPTFACKDSLAFTKDKQQHAVGSALLGAGSRSLIKDPWEAFGAAMIPGVLKEVYDLQNPQSHCASLYDLLYDAVGAGIGVYTTNWIIGPGVIIYHVEW